MRLYIISILLSSATCIWAQTLQQETCDAGRMMVDIDPNNTNVILGGLFEMREAGANGYGCGDPHSEVMLGYEAARWTLRRINSNNYIPGIKIGMKAYDTCSSSYHALAAANSFYPQYSASSLYCNQTAKLNLGLLGTYVSWTTKPVAELTSKFPASMISPAASSPLLSDKSKYSYFLRTGISATEQINSMIAVMVSLNWKRIIIVYSNNDYGLDSMRQFIYLSQQKLVCIVATIPVPAQRNLTEYYNKLQGIGNYDMNGAVFFGDHSSLVAVMDTIDALDATFVKAKNIQWIVSLVNMNEQFTGVRIRGAIYVQPTFTEVSEFFTYFTTELNEISPPPENPWYQDWFMKTFHCRLPGINYLPYSQYSNCTSKNTTQKATAINKRYAFVDSTIKAVLAYAKALKTAFAATCGNVQVICLALQRMTAAEFHRNYLMNVDLDLTEVNISSLQGQRVKFDANGDFYTSAHRVWNYNNQSSSGFTFKLVGNNASSVDTSQTFMYNGNRSAVLPSLPSSQCLPEGCTNCVMPQKDVQFSYSPGDIILAGLFDLHAQGSEILTCGTLKTMHAVNAAAFKYAISHVKSDFPSILPGINLGAMVIDLCDNAEMGTLLLNNLLGGRTVVSDINGQVLDPNQVIGVVGELDSTEAISMASMLGNAQLPYIESSATSVVFSSNPDMFPSFTRAIPSDYNQMLAIVLLLKRMNWNYVQVIHTPDSYGTLGYQIIKNETSVRGICIAAHHELNTDGDHAAVVLKLKQKPEAKVIIAVVDTSDYQKILQAIQNYGMQGQFILIGTETWGRRMSVVRNLESAAVGSITVDVVSPQITNFTNWLSSLNPSNANTIKDMPFFTEWYQYTFNCYLDANNRIQFSSECPAWRPITYEITAYTPFMISATYALARALDQTLQDFCGDAFGNYSGICWQFRSDPLVKSRILTYLKNSNFMQNGYHFVMKDGEGQANYQLYTFTGMEYKLIGEYLTGSKVLSNLQLSSGVKSTCTSLCSECVYVLQAQPYFILPGPQLKLGVNFAGSDPGTDPFMCGDLRWTNGIQLYLAVAYALEQVNNGLAPVSLNKVQVGALLFDHCNSAARAYGLPSALYSGILEAPDTAEPIPNLNSLRAWLTDNTLVTNGMKDFFSKLNLPVISPMATSNTFLNKVEFPTFLRTVQGDTSMATALAVLVKSLGLQYISVLYSEGSTGQDTFITIARQQGLCIIGSILMNTVLPDNLVSNLIAQPTNVIITYLDQADMDNFLAARARNPNGKNLLIISPEPYPYVFNKYGLGGGNVLSLRMKTNGLPAFVKYVSMVGKNGTFLHPSLRTYYMDMLRCDLPGEYRYNQSCDLSRNVTSSPDFYTDNYVLPTINAVYTFVAAVHETLKVQCGANYNYVCTQFYSDPNTNTMLRDKMMRATFQDSSDATFKYIGQEGNTGREIVYFNGTSMRKVADFAGASINIIDRNLPQLFAGIRSSCYSPCGECINNSTNFTYIPGDILLGGIFDVHKSALTPFSCGDINTLHGFQLLEAFHFAINKVNDKSDKFANVLKNVKLGGIGLDACQSGIRGGYIVSNIHSRLTVLTRDSQEIMPDTIDTYIGTYSSGMSIQLARLLKSLQMPQISYGSTSVDLLDKDRYPYFLRTVPADDKQVKAMIQFLKRFNIYYVQVVHSANNYGEQGAAIFNSSAVDICVAQTVSFPDNSEVTSEGANDVVLALLQKPVANTVVVFADASYVNELLQAVRRNKDAVGKFKFIGSDTWANNVEATQGVEDLALSSVTFDLDVADLREFDTYLSTKTPSNYPDNPWFPEYYEAIANCYLTVPDPRYRDKCSSIPKNIVTSTNYKQDTALIHVINAVFSAALGLDALLKETCGVNYTTVCEAYKNLNSRRYSLYQKIKNSSFVDMSGQLFSFSDRGDGNKGYIAYSIDASNILGYVYNPIARFSTNEQLTMLKTDYKPLWDDSCNRQDSCTECPAIRNLKTRFWLPNINNQNNKSPATLILSASVHNQGNDEYRCGRMSMRDFLLSLSVLWTIKYSGLINNVFDLRPLILDNCNNPLRIDQDLLNLMTTGALCNDEFSAQGITINQSTIVGVQTMGSLFVVAANRITSPLKIQLMSSSATSTALSDQWRYPYFARTVPPDNVQMEVIAKILKENSWSYVAVIYSLESYGINAFRALQTVLNSNSYSCIGIASGIPAKPAKQDITLAMQSINSTKGIGVIVLVHVDPRSVLQGIIEAGLAGSYVVIGTDTWAHTQTVTEGIAEQFAGSITIGFRDSLYNIYINWLQSITWNNRQDIPTDWFEEFYQHIHMCQLSMSSVKVTEYSTPCTLDLIITPEKLWRHEIPGIVAIAVPYAMGNGLANFHRAYGCAGKTFTQCMATVKNVRDVLFNYTLQQTWNVPTNSVTPEDNFTLELGYDDRYWNVGYTIYTLLNDNTYVKIGNQTSKGFVFDGHNYQSQRPSLVSKCPTGQSCDCVYSDIPVQQKLTKLYVQDHEPRNYFLYNKETGARVYTWPVWAIAVAVLSSFGILIGLLLFFFFLIFYPIKGGTTVLGFFNMLGMLGIYAINFAFFLPASKSSCGTREFLQGVLYAVLFAPLLVKAVDNWRFKDSEYSPKRYSGLTNPLALVLIAIGIVLVQCIIPIEWLILRNPSASMMPDPTYRHDWMWCDAHNFYDISLVLSMVFIIFLVVLTAVFSALAWDSESNCYESRWIFVCCICTAGCFLVWMVVSTNAGPPYRDSAVAIGNLVNATAILIFIPIRKLVLLVQTTVEEKKAKNIPLDDVNHDVYSNMYTNQIFQGDVYEPDSKPNSDDGY